MSKKSLFFFFICSSYLVNAQYTNVINSNRPGFSESPYSVGSGIYQLETGFFYNTSKIVRTFTIPNSFGYNMVFRTSFLNDKLEFNSNFTLQSDKIAFKNVFTSDYYTTGISDLSFGAKYLVFHQEYEDKSKEVRSWKKRHAFDWKRAIPSVAVYLGINTNLVNNIYKLEGLTPKVGVLLQNNLTNDLNIISNLFIDNIGSDYSEFSYIITGTYAINENWSAFLEHQGTHNSYETNNDFGTGVAYLFSRHFQVDTSTRLNFNGKTTAFYSGIGFSFRLDRHVPDFDIVDESGNKIIIEEPKSTKKKNFFGRFIDFFKFKKKKKETEKSYDRKKPERKRIKATVKNSEKEAKKKKGGFFSFLKRKNKKKKTEPKKKDDTKKEDDTKTDN
jgi:hypothetical protein